MTATVTTALCRCCHGRPSPDATYCRVCARALEQTLFVCVHIEADLDDAVARQLTRSACGGKQPRRPEFPIPIDLGASDRAHRLRDTLRRWVLTFGAPYPDTSIRGYAVSLLTWREQIRQHDQGALAHREITRAVRAALAVIDRPAERVGYGRCDNCRAPIFGDPGATAVVCDCGTYYDNLTARRERMVAQADALGTPAEIAATLAQIGRRVLPSTIRTWASRGRLEQRPAGSNLYRLSDVLGLVAERDARAAS